MAETPEKDDPILQLKGLGNEFWASLAGGDAVIAWLRWDVVMPSHWECIGQDAAREDTSGSPDHRP